MVPHNGVSAKNNDQCSQRTMESKQENEVTCTRALFNTIRKLYEQFAPYAPRRKPLGFLRTHPAVSLKNNLEQHDFLPRITRMSRLGKYFVWALQPFCHIIFCVSISPAVRQASRDLIKRSL